ncbi:poly-gamma-glutamate system protein [candidate division WOR-3 bacterium]|nr:poly-gamma-glutamate system protein [candidate division WOR-3 bacterium]
MKQRDGKIPVYLITFIAVLSIVLFTIEETNKIRIDDPYCREKIEATKLCLKGFSIIRKARDSLELTIDVINDPNATGLIGSQYSLITEGMSNLTEKLTTLNPNFSAVIVEMLKKCRVKSGDIIAIGWTGSYPAINIALLSACEVLKLHPVIISSVGSSMWGANISSYTWLDMERYLHENGIFSSITSSASIGGKGDIGIGFSPEGRNIIKRAIQRSYAGLIEADNIEDAVDSRVKIYGDSIKVFVNVGWGVANIGEENEELKLGVNRKTRSIRLKGKSVAKEMAIRGIPIINLVSFEKLAAGYGLPIAPVPIPTIGEGSLYYEERYSVPLAIIFILIIIVILFISMKYEVESLIRYNKYYTRRK